MGQLVPVQPRRALVDVGDVEPTDGFGIGEDLVIAVAPAQAGQIVAQGLGQIALVGIVAHGLGTVALGQLGPVGTVDQRDMGEGRLGKVQGLIDQGLTGGIVQVVIAANDVGDAHVVVIDDDCQIVGRRSVGAQQHQIVQILVVEGHGALDQILDDGVAIGGATEANHEGLVVHLRTRRPVAPGRAQGLSVGAGLLALGLGLFARHEAAIGPALGHQILYRLPVPVGSGELEHRFGIGVEAQPVEAMQDGRYRRLGRAFAVRVLNAQKEGSAAVTGIKPVE